jgi:hypothetical protein
MPTVDEIKTQIRELGKKHGILEGSIVHLRRQNREGPEDKEVTKQIEVLEAKRHNIELEIRRHCADLNSVSMQQGGA